MSMLLERLIDCPYCAEQINVLVDPSDMNETYIEDCQVCCRAIVFKISVEESFDNTQASVVVNAFSDDEAY